MKIVIKSKTSPISWMIRPYRDGTCLEIFKTPLKKTAKKQWCSTERYPTSIRSALRLVLEMAENDPNDTAEFEVESYNELVAMYKAWLAGIEIDVSE